jgi:uncharacterized phage-associated protein
MNNIIAFCNLTLAYCKVNALPITHLQLQKVLYYLQGWSLAYLPEPFFTDEPQAWINGPVYPLVWEAYRNYGDNEIPQPEVSEEQLTALVDEMALNDDGASLAFAVLEKYATKNAGWLVQQTHAEQPWKQTRQGLGPFESSKKTIPLELIKSYFEERVQKLAVQIESAS